MLEAYGFEPRTNGDQVTLANCLFHALTQKYTELVCGMNLALLDGLAATGLTAHLDPTLALLLRPSRTRARYGAITGLPDTGLARYGSISGDDPRRVWQTPELS